MKHKRESLLTGAVHLSHFLVWKYSKIREKVSDSLTNCSQQFLDTHSKTRFRGFVRGCLERIGLS